MRLYFLETVENRFDEATSSNRVARILAKGVQNLRYDLTGRRSQSHPRRGMLDTCSQQVLISCTYIFSVQIELFLLNS